jgi:hypothetical protein
MLITPLLIIYMLPFSSASGQEKITEQRIRIIIDDSSGREVIVDTLIKDSPACDSILFKDGKVIYLNQMNEAAAERTLSSEESQVNKKGVTTWSDKDDKWHGEKVMIINNERSTKYNNTETEPFQDKTENKVSDREKAKYVISKNGMIITVEGDDYVKVKELVNEIENKLDVKPDPDSKRCALSKRQEKRNRKK